jgi:hypothetical protein
LIVCVVRFESFETAIAGVGKLVRHPPALVHYEEPLTELIKRLCGGFLPFAIVSLE